MGNAVYAAAQWAIVLALVKVSSVAAVGQFAFGIAIVTPIFMFANLQLRSVQATDTLRKNCFGHFMALRLLGIPAALCLVLMVLVFGGYPQTTVYVVVVIALGKAIESLSDVVYGELQSGERLDLVAKSMMLKAVASVLLLTCTIAMTGSLLLGLIANAGVGAVVLVGYDVPNGAHALSARRRGPVKVAFGGELLPVFEFAPIGRLFFTALPLAAVVVVGSLNSQIPRYFVERESGAAELGIYASLCALFSGLYFFQVALGHAMLPALARSYNAGDRAKYFRYVGVVLGVGAANGLLALALAVMGGATFLRFAFSDEFANSGQLFLWLAVASTLQCFNGALAYFLHAARRFKQTAWAAVASTPVIITAAGILIPRLGPLGGAFAMLSGLLVSSLVLGVQFVLLMRSFKEIRYAT
ncbi:Polysaccharide biosynthesis protein [Rosistilla carotiformis]|uniref:Polysaccharide biosynthesis protein n=1 Tax=Rosistilla carotiformis TaxID=2528017 RepID=A0A518JNZ3_9BACT|nr:hypothetical protein [Rosistilla carotiformis]QDV67253.1 Polysaccharide biosynthesis protein [Rosistilla carotiformis]